MCFYTLYGALLTQYLRLATPIICPSKLPTAAQKMSNQSNIRRGIYVCPYSTPKMSKTRPSHNVTPRPGNNTACPIPPKTTKGTPVRRRSKVSAHCPNHQGKTGLSASFGLGIQLKYKTAPNRTTQINPATRRTEKVDLCTSTVIWLRKSYSNTALCTSWVLKQYAKTNLDKTYLPISEYLLAALS